MLCARFNGITASLNKMDDDFRDAFSLWLKRELEFRGYEIERHYSYGAAGGQPTEEPSFRVKPKRAWGGSWGVSPEHDRVELRWEFFHMELLIRVIEPLTALVQHGECRAVDLADPDLDMIDELERLIDPARGRTL